MTLKFNELWQGDLGQPYLEEETQHKPSTNALMHMCT